MTLDNIVTLKSGLGSPKVIDTDTIQKSQKILYPNCIWCPAEWWPRLNFANMFDTHKTRIIDRATVYIEYHNISLLMRDKNAYRL